MIMQENIEIALQNCVSLEHIDKQAEDLQAQSGMFKTRAKVLRSKVWWKLCKMRLLIAFIIIGARLPPPPPPEVPRRPDSRAPAALRRRHHAPRGQVRLRRQGRRQKVMRAGRRRSWSRIWSLRSGGCGARATAPKAADAAELGAVAFRALNAPDEPARIVQPRQREPRVAATRTRRPSAPGRSSRPTERSTGTAPGVVRASSGD